MMRHEILRKISHQTAGDEPSEFGEFLDVQFPSLPGWKRRREVLNNYACNVCESRFMRARKDKVFSLEHPSRKMPPSIKFSSFLQTVTPPRDDKQSRPKSFVISANILNHSLYFKVFDRFPQVKGGLTGLGVNLIPNEIEIRTLTCQQCVCLCYKPCLLKISKISSADQKRSKTAS